MTHTTRRVVRAAGILLAVAMLSLAASPSASAQRPAPGASEMYLQADGATVAATWYVDGYVPIPVPLGAMGAPDRLRSLGWTGEGVMEIIATGPGAQCRIIGRGVVQAQDAGPAAVCRWDGS